jgi:hypothetical protein
MVENFLKLEHCIGPIGRVKISLAADVECAKGADESAICAQFVRFRRGKRGYRLGRLIALQA